MGKYILKQALSLKPYKNNPRTHSPEQIKQLQKSLKQFGFVNPVLIDKHDMIIAGHGRVQAAVAEGINEIPCVLIDSLTEKQIRAYIIADNRLAELAGWDMEILEFELTELDSLGFDMETIGFDLETEFPDSTNVQEDDYDIEVPKEPKTRPGQMYELGKHRLICGDATDKKTVTELFKDGEWADLLITDPPYNVDYTGCTKEHLQMQNDKMDSDDFRTFLKDSFSAADSVMRKGAVFYIWHADSEGYNIRGACHDIGWQIRQCLIWNKNSFVVGRQDYQWKHEPCLYGWKSGAAHMWHSDRKQSTILDFNRPTRNEEHPTMKPILLFNYLILNSKKKKDIVMDMFGGSGTTLIACEQNDRAARVMEIDPRYCDVIVDRWEKFTGSKAVTG